MSAAAGRVRASDSERARANGAGIVGSPRVSACGGPGDASPPVDFDGRDEVEVEG